MENDSRTQKIKSKNRRFALFLTLGAIGMLGFGFALIPFYNLICQALNINGKTGGQVSISAPPIINNKHKITIQFLATTNDKLPWAFYPKQKKITLHPGESQIVYYVAKNNSKRAMTVQAIPSVAPGIAAKYLKKTECFCFRQQVLKPGASITMPIKFYVDTDMPDYLKTISLSYTLFAADQFKKSKRLQGKEKGKLSG